MKTALLLGLILFPVQDEKQASELLEKAWDRLQKADMISIRAEMLTRGGGMEALSQKAELLVKRPNLARVALVEGDQDFLVVADGRILWTWFESEKKYLKMEQLEGMLGELLPAGIVPRMFLEKSKPEWFKDAGEVKVSREKLEEQDCQVISMKLPDLRMRVWVDSEGRIRKSEEIFEVQGDALTQTTVYGKENLAPEVKESDFSFTPPEGAEEMKMGGGRERGDDLLPVGSDAPAFECTDLEGRSVKLSDLQGKVVLLNFWFYH